MKKVNKRTKTNISWTIIKMSLFVCGPLGLTQKCGKLTILKTFLLALIRLVMLTWTKKQSLKAITKKNVSIATQIFAIIHF